MKKLISKLLLFTALTGTVAQTSTLSPNRVNDPIVMTGNQLPSYSTLAPSSIVGFKFSNGVWTQIPLQIDERKLLDIVIPYRGVSTFWGSTTPNANNPKILFYCDALTGVGVDTNTNFDADDELVFMAKDAGGLYDGVVPHPAGIDTSTCQQVAIADASGTGYIYLFKNTGSWVQGAGVSYVTYASNVTTVAGFPSHGSGLNPENTTITTPKYSWHFASEWVSDQFKIALGTNVDILDRHKNFFANGNCFRHEDTFSSDENAYLTNKVGAIRVIRSYMGTNSGPETTRTNTFYAGRQDIKTTLRVHNVPSVYDVFDYNSAANGMIYTNNLNAAGVTINGVPDNLVKGVLNWEQIKGNQGTASILYKVTTNMTATEGVQSSYYDDNSVNPASNCTGDGQAWGTSGIGLTFNNQVCTDPVANTNGCASANLRGLETLRIIYADAPSVSNNIASEYYTLFTTPPTVSISSCQQLLSTEDFLTNNNTKLKLYPNPSTGRVNIEGLEKGENYMISAYNMNGQLVKQVNLKDTNFFNLKSTGDYLIKITGKDTNDTKKIIIR